MRLERDGLVFISRISELKVITFLLWMVLEIVGLTVFSLPMSFFSKSQKIEFSSCLFWERKWFSWRLFFVHLQKYFCMCWGVVCCVTWRSLIIYSLCVIFLEYLIVAEECLCRSPLHYTCPSWCHFVGIRALKKPKFISCISAHLVFQWALGFPATLDPESQICFHYLFLCLFDLQFFSSTENEVFVIVELDNFVGPESRSLIFSLSCYYHGL